MASTEHLNINMTCNQDCIFCILHRFHNNKQFSEQDTFEGKSLNDIKKRLDEIIKYEENLTILGAEPTLRPDLLEIIEYAKEIGFKKIEICSNCLKMDDKEYVEKLKKSGLTTVVTSLHSDKPNICDEITQVKGSFDKIVNGIKNLFDSGIDVRVTHVICSKNYKHLLDFVDFFKKNFPILPESVEMENISFLFLQSPIVIEQEPEKKDIVKNMMPKFSDIENYLKQAMDFCFENDIRFTVEGIPLCFLKDYEFFSVDTIEMCQEEIIFIKNKNNKINYTKKYLDIRSKGNQCQFCVLNNYCTGPWQEYIQVYGEDELKPFKDKNIFLEFRKRFG